MIEISFDKDLIGPWICSRINKTWGPDGREAIGLVREGEVLGAVLFEDYTGPGGSISVHVAIDNPRIPIRKLLSTSAGYAFNQLKVEKLIGLVPSYNTAALKFDMRIGFKPEAVIKNAFPNGDMVVLTMTREDCGFVPRRKEAAA